MNQSLTKFRFFILAGITILSFAPMAVPVATAQEKLESDKPASKKLPSVLHAVEFNHIALDTPRREEAIAFYEKTFGMTNISHGRTVRDTFLHFDKGFMNLGEAETAGLNHFCLGIENFDRDTVYRMLSLLDLKPFLMGGNNLHIYDPDGLNVQIQEIGHGYGRIAPSDLRQSKKGLMETTSIHHLSLTVTDVSRSRDFYTEMFGLRVISNPNAELCMLGVGHGFMELRKGTKPGMNHFCLAVKDFEPSKVASKLKNSGLAVLTLSNSTISFPDSSGLVVHVTSDSKK